MTRTQQTIVTQGGTALITGASSGIGEEFARRLAAVGMRLVLVARSENRLRQLAEDLAGSYGIEARFLALDLIQPDATQEIADHLAEWDWEVDLLINNAGFGTNGLFDALSLPRQRDEIALNVTALVALTHALLPGMLRRKRGVVINVASTAGFQPLPYMAIYGATKAFVLSFTEALAVEYEGTGVHFQALCPGNTETPFHEVVGSTNGRVGQARTTEQVVQTSLRALRGHRVVVIDGTLNALLAQSPRLLPRGVAARIAGMLLRPR